MPDGILKYDPDGRPELEWEIIFQRAEGEKDIPCAWRAPVIGGWLVMSKDGHAVFVPDVHHRWKDGWNEPPVP